MLLAPRFWYQPRNVKSYLLSPFSFLYRMAITFRRWCYQVGIKKIHYFDVPVIVVGNISVGGVGKTPLVVWLAKELKKHHFQPGIVSRGYGGEQKRYVQMVTASSDPQKVGDEAILLAKKTNCPMAVSTDRPAAVNKLLSDYHCDIVISDDGLQHYALARDIEIAVIGGQKSYGNRFCLPAGPLREPISRLDKVDFVINNGSFRSFYAMHVEPQVIYQLTNPENKLIVYELAGRTVHAVAGIGHPQRFFQQLRDLGAKVTSHPFSDHHHYRSADFNFGDDAFIVMTEKDAVKCHQFTDDRMWCLVVETSVTPQFQQDFFSSLLERRQE